MIARFRRYSWRLFLSSFALAVVSSMMVLVLSNPGQSAVMPRYVEVAETSGDVTFQGRPVAAGDRLAPTTSNGLRTGSSGRARLVLDDGIGSVEVSPDSELNVSNLQTLPSGGKTSELLLASGRARVQVRRFNNPDSRFNIRTPAGNAGVRGTQFLLYVRPDGETHLNVLEGRVAFRRRDTEDEVDCGPDSGWIMPVDGEPIQGGPIFGDFNLRFELLGGAQQGQVRVTARINPTSTVQLNGATVAISRQGQLDQVVPLPADRRLRLVVRDLFEREQTYELLVPPAASPLPNNPQG